MPPSNDWVSLPTESLKAFFTRHDLDSLVDDVIDVTGADSVDDLKFVDVLALCAKLELKMVAAAKLKAAFDSLASTTDAAHVPEPAIPLSGSASTGAPECPPRDPPEQSVPISSIPVDVPMKVEEAVAICIDRSGSMRSPLSTERSRMEAVKQMFYAFRDRVDSLGEGRHRLGLLQFDSEVETLLQLTSQLDLFEASVDNMRERGQTAIYSAIVASVEMLKPVFKEAPGADLRVFALTDGQNNSGLDWRAAANAALSIGAVVDAVIVGERPDENLRRIVSVTGGQCFSIKSLEAGFELLEAETVASLRARRGGADKPPFQLRTLSAEPVPLAQVTESDQIKRANDHVLRTPIRCLKVDAVLGAPSSQAISTEQKAEWLEAFKQYASCGHMGDNLKIADLGVVLRAVGQAPTDAELADMAAELHPGRNAEDSFLSFEDFCMLMSRRMCDSDSEESLLEAFKALDPAGTGRIDASDLAKVITAMGESVSKAELDEMMRDADADGSGTIVYADFVRAMLNDELIGNQSKVRGGSARLVTASIAGGVGNAGGGENAGHASPAVRRRIMKELRDFAAFSAGTGVHVFPSEANLLEWRALVEGPVGSPFEGGTWVLTIDLPTDYPFKAPRVRFLTPVFHCNVNDSGSLCLDILHNNWSPALSVPKVLEAVRNLLADPNPNDAMRQSIAELTLAHIQHGQADMRYIQAVRDNIAMHASKTVDEWRTEWGCDEATQE
mmetsp:Transcript_14383/g.38830  ORF Transcript_14383/g.38830 Transcript_14383/m.38830 type:complete len:729 (+) Transcript_14383:470-2656(+)|eukprot:CAMPEP_0185185400 /NCGR_PEP_ID=MMETSP1140-20130426/3260_1 /TAXON_ID=298111 /ORGANISM="Pavlova sp., Strain CCMP459" /LENGTH=728 /DNA_ID=CAMNT_0027751581 /DNA_START=284 /DNA_END=2470 /DNA_ORIENTATION=+